MTDQKIGGFDRELLTRIEQFYYREARLLDQRRFQEWGQLLAEDLRYTMPARHSPQQDNRKRESAEFHELSTDTSGAQGMMLRDETYFHMLGRLSRVYKPSAWAENPPARTTRIVSNIELEKTEGGLHQCHSVFLLSFSRHGAENVHYTGRRKDVLRSGDADTNFKIVSREVLLDWNVITAPTVGLFF